MLRRYKGVVLILLLTEMCSSVAVEVEVGESKIQLPEPDGFVEVTALHAPAREIAQAITPPNNRLLAIYLHRSDLEAINTGKKASWNRYMMVQIDRQTEPFDISGTDFVEFRTTLKTQQEILLNHVRDQVDEYFVAIKTGIEPHTKLKVGYLLPLGIFADENQRLASESLSKYRQGNKKGDDSFLVIGATNVLHIGKHVVFAYVYSHYQDENDRQWVKLTSDQWSADILRANPTSFSLLGRLQQIEWRQFAGLGLLSLFIAAGIGVFFSIRRQRSE